MGFDLRHLVGLLCATGLRPAEALALDRADVDLENGVLSIRQTKFGNPASFLFLNRHLWLFCGMQKPRRDLAAPAQPRIFHFRTWHTTTGVVGRAALRQNLLHDRSTATI
jgi:integrase